MIEVRRARSDDAQTLARLGAETFTTTFGHLYKPEDLSAFLAKSHSFAAYQTLLADSACAAWIAENSTGMAMGYCVAGPCTLPVPDPKPQSGELSRLYLRPEAQGLRLGSQMLDIALAWLTSRYKHVYLSVYAENVRAQRLYESRGFGKICEYFYMVGAHADPEWIMELASARAAVAPQQGAGR
jgi:ribosomal protein S18 acetylase RimI-like enzyme